MDFTDNRGNLGDIMVESDAAPSRSRKIAFLSIGVVVLLGILAIVTWALLSKDDVPESAASERTEGALPISSADEFERVELDESEIANDKFNQIVRDIKAKQNQGQLPPAPTSAATPSAAAAPSAPVAAAPSTPATPAATAAAPKPVATSTNNAKPAESKKTESKSAPKPAQTASAPKPATPVNLTPEMNPSEAALRGLDPDTMRDTSKNGNIATRGHYYQVGVFAQTPNAEFIAKISKYGFRVEPTTLPNGEGATKYLIGPYENKTDMARDLLQITTEITKPVYYEVK